MDFRQLLRRASALAILGVALALIEVGLSGAGANDPGATSVVLRLAGGG